MLHFKVPCQSWPTTFASLTAPMLLVFTMLAAKESRAAWSGLAQEWLARDRHRVLVRETTSHGHSAARADYHTVSLSMQTKTGQCCACRYAVPISIAPPPSSPTGAHAPLKFSAGLKLISNRPTTRHSRAPPCCPAQLLGWVRLLAAQAGPKAPPCLPPTDPSDAQPAHSAGASGAARLAATVAHCRRCRQQPSSPLPSTGRSSPVPSLAHHSWSSTFMSPPPSRPCSASCTHTATSPAGVPRQSAPLPPCATSVPHTGMVARRSTGQSPNRHLL